MKKITKPTGNIRLVGQAEKDGVAFQATKLKGPFGVSLLGTLATVTENGDIICEQWTQKESVSPIHAKIAKISKTALYTTGSLAILFIAAYFALIMLTEKAYHLLFDLSYIMISAIHICKAIGIFIVRIFGNKEIKSFSKFLAAKNAVENAYYHLGKVPSILDAKMHSTFSYYSDYISLSDAALSTSWLIMTFIIHFPMPWKILGFLAILGVIFIFTKKNLFLFWQFLIVSKPEDIHYQAAITALEDCLGFMDNVHLHVATGSEEELLKILQFDEKKCEGCPNFQNCKELFQSSK